MSNDGKTYTTVSNTCTGKDDICTYFVRLLPDFIKIRNESAPLGWFIGFLGILNMIGILFLTIIEYNNDELSDRNIDMVKKIKYVFISNVVTVFVIGILSYLIFTKDEDLSFKIYKETYAFLKKLKSTEALVFFMIYLFSSSVYMLHESRMIYKLRVNNLVAE